MTSPFDERFEGMHDVREMLQMLRDAIANGDVPENEMGAIFQVMEAITADDEPHDAKHEITGPYVSALYAMGEDDVAKCMVRVDLIIVDHNIALGIKGRAEGAEHAQSEAGQAALLQALRGVLCAHGLGCEIRDGKLGFYAPPPDPWEESIAEFQRELEEMDDPMSKWYKNKPKQGDKE